MLRALRYAWHTTHGMLRTLILRSANNNINDNTIINSDNNTTINSNSNINNNKEHISIIIIVIIIRVPRCTQYLELSMR